MGVDYNAAISLISAAVEQSVRDRYNQDECTLSHRVKDCAAPIVEGLRSFSAGPDPVNADDLVEEFLRLRDMNGS